MCVCVCIAGYKYWDISCFHTSRLSSSAKTGRRVSFLCSKAESKDVAGRQGGGQRSCPFTDL